MKRFCSVKRDSGFTLVEVMVVVAILTLVATYFANFFINRLTYQEVRLVANEMMTLSRALTSYYTDYGQWPGVNMSNPSNITCQSAEVFSGSGGNPGVMPNYLMGYDSSAYDFDCSEPTKIVASRDIDNTEFGEILEGYLPSAQFLPGDPQAGLSHKIELHILRPRLPLAIDFFDVASQGGDSISVPFPANCPKQWVAISVSTDAVCTRNGDPIGGYFINVDKRDRDDEWVVSLRARADQEFSYRAISECDGQNIHFRGMTFCERN